MPTIYLSVNGGSTNLRLRDSEGHDPGNDNITTTVSVNDNVTWEPDPTPPAGARAISSIVSIYRKNLPGNGDLLTSQPNNNGTGQYVATVKAVSPGPGTQESYGVQYTLQGSSTIYTDDPKLQMQ